MLAGEVFPDRVISSAPRLLFWWHLPCLPTAQTSSPWLRVLRALAPANVWPLPPWLPLAIPPSRPPGSAPRLIWVPWTCQTPSHSGSALWLCPLTELIFPLVLHSWLLFIFQVSDGCRPLRVPAAGSLFGKASHSRLWFLSIIAHHRLVY